MLGRDHSDAGCAVPSGGPPPVTRPPQRRISMAMAEATGPDGHLRACPKCACPDLFVRKAFPQKLGLAMVLVAAVSFLALASNPRTFTLGLVILAVATAIDAVLYVVVPRVTVCYRCRAEFPRIPINPEHEGFDLAVGEKYRSG